MTHPHRFRVIRVTGSAYERGESYGTQTRDEIRRSVEGYELAFAKQRGWSWAEAVAQAAPYEAVIEDSFPELITEMRGIAAGAGLTFADILTLNCRTELLWPGLTATAPLGGARECTSFGLTPERTASGEVWVGQNWDWLVHGVESVVMLEVERDERPNFVTIVEAGLLAKAGMNASGVAVVANALVSSADLGDLGLPFHIMLRAVLDCETLTDVVHTLHERRRASSANYLVGEASGAVMNLEVAPGGVDRASVLLPQNGAVVHANHFQSPPAGITDLAPLGMSDSYVRQQRMSAAVAEHRRTLTLDDVHETLCDHAGFPNSVCCHPDPRDAEGEQWQTVLSVVFEPATQTMYLAPGTPCTNPKERFDLSAFLGTPPAFTVPPEHLDRANEGNPS